MGLMNERVRVRARASERESRIFQAKDKIASRLLWPENICLRTHARARALVCEVRRAVQGVSGAADWCWSALYTLQ